MLTQFVSQEFTLEVFVRETSVGQKEHICMTHFLAAWLGLLPFSLQELRSTLPPKRDLGRHFEHLPTQLSVAVPPFRLEERVLEKFEEARAAFHLAVDEADRDFRRMRAGLSLTSSSVKEPSLVGGVSTKDSSNRGVLARYYKEVLPCLPSEDLLVEDFLNPHLGLRSSHRDSGSFLANSFEVNSSTTRHWSRDTFMTLENTAWAKFMFRDSAKRLNAMSSERESVKSAFMEDIENLGHESYPQVPGLNIQLLPFQQESVQWAIERETIPGGIKGLSWISIPRGEQKLTNIKASLASKVYFNPGNLNLSKNAPSLVRGGLIADEMGLGKTVVSLALILRHPAQAIPAPGSSSTDIPAQVPDGETTFWDPSLSIEAQKTNKKRGSIVSHGTLVVVSSALVWNFIYNLVS